MNGILSIILLIYFVCHLPAFVLLYLGWRNRKSQPEQSKKYYIYAGIYFIVGAGICGKILMG